MTCSELPPATIAAALVNPGQECVIYVADAREIDESGQGEPSSGTLSFPLPAGKCQVRLYSPARGEYLTPARTLEGGDVSLPLEPFLQGIVVRVTASP